MKNKTSLTLKGINCAACAPQIEKIMSGIDGIQDITVNAITKIVSFTYDSDKNSVSDIEVILRNSGYRTDDSSTELYEKELYTLQKLLWFS